MAVEENQPSESETRRIKLWRAAIAILVLLSAATAYHLLSDDGNVPITRNDPLRMPAGKPLLEPDRPDLIGDPGIEKEDNEHTDIPEQ